MKITITSNGEISFDIDAHNPTDVGQALLLAQQMRNGTQTAATARTLLMFASDDDDELPAEDLIVPASNNFSEDERIAARLQTREQLETWLYLRRNDRVRGIALSGLAHRFRLSSTAASARCATLVKMGYAVRIGKGYYRAVVPTDD